MPRQARERSRSGIYHIMLRGINQQTIFEEDEDRHRFIKTLGYYKTISNYALHGYCLMNNHVHLLIRENDESISQVIKRVSSSYVYWYNQKYDRCSHLFQDRFRSEVVETDAYFLVALRYIHQNPLRAGMVKDNGTYLWSSYREYVGTPIITDIDFALDIFSKDRVKAIARFISYNNEATADECIDNKGKVHLPDKEVMKYLNELGIFSISAMQRLEKEERDAVIRKMKAMQNVSIRQLARITGISKSVIDRI